MGHVAAVMLLVAGTAGKECAGPGWLVAAVMLWWDSRKKHRNEVSVVVASHEWVGEIQA